MIKIFYVFMFFISFLLSNNNNEEHNITLQLKWKHQFQFAGYYTAIYKGFYKQAGLNVTIKEAFPNMNMVDEVLNNNAQFGIGISGLVLDFAKGKNVVVLGAIFQHSPLAIMSLKENIKTIHDLVGKKIMIEDGSADIFALFKREHVNQNSLKILEHSFNPDTLINKEVDAMSVYSIDEPFYLQQKQIAYNIFSPQEAGIDFYGDNIFTSKEMIEKNPEIVEAFRQASLKGWKYAMSNQDEIINLIMQNYNTQNKTKEYFEFEAKNMQDLIYPDILEIGYMHKGRWQHIVNVYKELGFLNKEINLDDFLYASKKNLYEEYKYVFFISAFFIIILSIVGYIAYYIYKINLKLSKSEQKHKILFQHFASAGIVWKKGFVITAWNEQATKLFGWNAEEIIGKNFFDFLIPAFDSEQVRKNLELISQDANIYIFNNSNYQKNGNIIVCEWHNLLLPNSENNEEFEVVSLAIDRTKALQNEEILKQKINYDSLTGIPNRHFFENILYKTYSLAKRNNNMFGIAFIDLDGFKNINDTYGHHAGDFLLQEIARRFQETIRKEDTIARLGGDEFALIFHVTQSDENYENVINRLLTEASTPIKYRNNIIITVSASIGITIYSSQNNISAKELLIQSDEAMYLAKKKGKNTFVVAKV